MPEGNAITARAKLCLINLAHLDPPNNGGVSQLAREVTLGLLSAPVQLQCLLVVRARFLPQFRRWLGLDGSVRIIPYSRFLPLPRILKLLRPTVIVSPLFGVEPFGFARDAAHVVSIPDTLVLDHPELFSPTQLQQRRQVYERSLAATTVITLSNFSRAQLVAHFPDSKAQIEVAGLGADLALPSAAEPPTTVPYIFYPANSWKHKRHDLLLHTMQRIWRARPDLKLVLSGGRPPDVDLHALIAQNAPAGAVIDLGYGSKAQLAAAYQHAEALLFTSQYEGFGMPLLEAMQAGCPVICAPVTAIPEVAAAAALYVNSDDPDDWAAAFLEQLPPQRETLIRAGYERAASFAWMKTREQWLRAVVSAADIR